MSEFLITYEDECGLEHHGILGQKWGVRRYQNPDGSLTDLGRKRYGYGYRDKAVSKSNFLSGIRSDIAAEKYASNKVKDARADHSLKMLDTTKEKAIRAQARADTYEDIANRRSQKENKTKSDWNVTIATKAAAANNRILADKYKEISDNEDTGTRIAKSLFEAMSGYQLDSNGKVKHYNSIGREYVVRNEVFMNTLTGGIYGSVKDYKYKKQYTAEERFNRINV